MSLRNELKKFYNENREVVEDIVKISYNREVGYLLENMKFGPRPSVIENVGDFFTMLDKGAISFHISLERWSNPMMLKDVKSKKEMNNLRIGWDLILDIDTEEFEISKLVTKEIIDFLVEKDVKKIYVKYSGGKGFHIAIPWETFPEKIEYIKKDDIVEEETKNLFPDLAREIATYIIEKIKNRIKDKIEKRYPEIIEKYNDVSSIIKVDTIAISNRHLIRCLYSINEKSGRLSIPIDIRYFEKFNPEYSKMENFVYEGIPFLTEEIKESEKIERFLRDVINWKINNYLSLDEKIFIETAKIEPSEEEKIKRKLNIEKKKYKGKINEDLFPPCIKKILSGEILDGRKRSIFILINFLKNIGWEFDEIEKKIIEWNNKLEDPLRERYVEYQNEWHKKVYSSGKMYLPPNCNNDMYYKEIGVCFPDEICKNIKNPILYPYKKLRIQRESKG